LVQNPHFIKENQAGIKLIGISAIWPVGFIIELKPEILLKYAK